MLPATHTFDRLNRHCLLPSFFFVALKSLCGTRPLPNSLCDRCGAWGCPKTSDVSHPRDAWGRFSASPGPCFSPAPSGRHNFGERTMKNHCWLRRVSGCPGWGRCPAPSRHCRLCSSSKPAPLRVPQGPHNSEINTYASIWDSQIRVSSLSRAGNGTSKPKIWGRGLKNRKNNLKK